MKRVTLLVSLVLSAATLSAHESDSYYNRVNLSASAEQEVENDLLIANLYSEHQAQQQKLVADHVNKAIRWALEKAKAVSSVKVQTTQYNTSPMYNKQVITGWRARQGIRLESKDTDAMSDLLGELQERLSIAAVNYGVSKENRDQSEELLMARALSQFASRAQLIAKELGRSGYRIVQLNVNSQGGNPVPIRYATRGVAMAAEAVAAPAIESGVQTVTVSVSGTIEVDPGS